jgi:1-acyl-sn-glycerol-3-phosphate acyltransferase
MLTATLIAILGLPVLAPVAIVVDLVRFRLRLPTLRVYLFLLQYGINDSVEILLAPIYWARAGLGTRLESPPSIARHERLQTWSVDLLVKRADRLLGLRIELDDADRQRLHPGPIIVVSRHVSLFDASLPGIVCSSVGLPVRGVIMAELLADPGFDLIYGRLGSVFIRRDNGPEAKAEIERMAAGAAPDAALVIFPEGRLFSSSVLGRQMAKIAAADPERARLLAGISSVLPPRPGGMQRLLASVPTADVVVIKHSGLDRFRKIADLAAAVPLSQTIRVEVERIARSSIPEDPQEQQRWLDQLWMTIDAEVSSRATPAHAVGGS